MGTRYDFKCRSCGYESVISGGRDRGQTVGTLTMHCQTCRELIDVRVTSDGVPPSSVLDRNWSPPELICPNGDGHAVSEWTAPGQCPKCGAMMEKIGSLEQQWD